MANEGAWNQGWAIGAGLAREQRARKQALSDEERETHLGELEQNISNLQQKYSSLLGPKGEDTLESWKAKYALTQAMQQRDALLGQQKTPGVGGKIGEKIGEALHLTKKPEAQSITVQPQAVNASAPTGAPVTLSAEPEYQATVEPGAKQPAAGTPRVTPAGPTTQAGVAPGATLPPMEEGAAPAFPARRAYTVQGPALPLSQLRAQAQAQQEATLLTAAAPVPAPTAWEKYRANWKEVLGKESEPPEEVKEEFARTGRVTEPKAEAESFKTQSIILSDGTTITAQQNTKSGDWFYLNKKPIPGELLEGAKSAPEELQPKTAWARDAKGKIYSVNLDARTHQEIPGTRNYGLVPPASLTGRITSGFYHYTDPTTGNVYQIPETHVSVPVGAGGGGAAAPAPTPAGGAATPAAPGAPSVPKTPGEAKRRAQQQPSAAGGAAPGAAQPGRVIGNKGTKDYIDTKTAYEAAVDRTKTMDENLKNALQGDQQAMISLVANHIGMTLGAQKGARINQAVWNEAVESAPWLSRSGARFDSRGFLSGVTLTSEQMRQMDRLAHEKVNVLKQHLDRLNSERTAGGAVAPTGGQSLADRLNNALGGK